MVRWEMDRSLERLLFVACTAVLLAACGSSANKPSDGGAGKGGADGGTDKGGAGTGGMDGGAGAAGDSGAAGNDGAPSGVDGQTDGGADTNIDSPFHSPTDVPADVPPELLPKSPTNLTAMVVSRRQASFQVSWTAPATSDGGPVSGYEVRYAKVPVTAANFDDATVTTAVTYPGTPAAVGAPDGIQVKGLYVENGYYFGVEALDASGFRSPVAATASAAIAHLNVATLTGSGAANEEFGFQMSASGDVNGDGHSDLLVGVFNGQHAYLYLGTTDMPPTSPSVVFSGDTMNTPSTTPSFGRGVSIIGDVDHDGIDDLAISDRATTARVFIFKGRHTWPATLGFANADYVITADATYSNNALLGSSIARLGDFNGDGVDDFAVAAHLFGTSQNGRVLVVLGKTGFGNIQLPDTTNTIVIDADTTLTTPLFGYRVLGLGHFYAGAGTTLVVGAPGTTLGTAGSEGHIYAFRGQGGNMGVIPVGSADNVIVGNALRTRIGTVLTNLGPVFSTLPAVGAGNPSDRSVPSGSAWLFDGNATSGPFASHVLVQQTTGTTINGQALIGGRVSGLDQTFSLIGDATPDVIQVPQSAPAFYIIDGTSLRNLSPLTTIVDSSMIGAVSIPFPASWTGTAEGGGALLPDINGDSFPDFAISSALGSVPGSVVIYW
jgi:hypothetical protein